MPVEDINLVFFHQKINALRGLPHHFVFAVYHLRHVHFEVGQADAVHFKLMLGVVKMLRAVEQRFRRDAAHVETGAAEHTVALDDGSFEAQLGTTDGGYIAARPGADDGNVVFHVQ